MIATGLFHARGRAIVLLLCGGDKSTQDRDIKLAKAMVKALKDED